MLKLSIASVTTIRYDWSVFCQIRFDELHRESQIAMPIRLQRRRRNSNQESKPRNRSRQSVRFATPEQLRQSTSLLDQDIDTSSNNSRPQQSQRCHSSLMRSFFPTDCITQYPVKHNKSINSADSSNSPLSTKLLR